MSIMGCCSSFIKCSDALACIHADDPYFKGCAYRHHLEAGRIFYGKNRNVFEPVTSRSEHTKPSADNSNKAVISDDHTDEILDGSIFLHCMKRVFAIYARQKNALSMNLDPDQVKKIESAFIDAGIPYKLQIDDMAECIIDKPTTEDPAPANSRVVFEINGEEYHVLNYNSWLIKQSIAERIAKAFDNHYIKARVELRGSYFKANSVYTISTYSNKPDQRPLDMRKTQETPVQSVEQISKEQSKPIQLSMFESITKQKLKDFSDTPNRTRIDIEATVKSHRLSSTASTANQQSIDISLSLIKKYSGICLVLADDKFNGAYLGELIKIRRMQMDYRFAHVRILIMLRSPRQDAIFNPDAIVYRDPYPIGTEQTFDIDDIRLIFGMEA